MKALRRARIGGMRLSDLAVIEAGALVVTLCLDLTFIAGFVVCVVLGVGAGIWLSLFGDGA